MKEAALESLYDLLMDYLINPDQYRVLTELIQECEESEFVGKVLELVKIVDSVPPLGYKVRVSDSAIAYLHYHDGSYECWVTQLNREDRSAFGISTFGDSPKFGRINMEELVDNGVELDLYWAPKLIGEVI